MISLVVVRVRSVVMSVDASRKSFSGSLLSPGFADFRCDGTATDLEGTLGCGTCGNWDAAETSKPFEVRNLALESNVLTLLKMFML
jgi:hypothetical protein